MKGSLPIRSLLRSHLRDHHLNDAAGHCDAEALAAFAEGTLHADEREPVIRHLNLCADCRETLALATQATLPAHDGHHRPAIIRLRWLYSATALVTLCLAALLFQSSRPPASVPLLQAPSTASLHGPLTQKSYRPAPTFLPRLTDALVTSPPNAAPKTAWRINSSRYPATLEISYNNRRTWSRIRTPQLQPQSVAWEGTTVWVANAEGTVLQSTDNGLHWTCLRPAMRVAPAN